jgi:prepilin-type N-terminal cleavage/methylation domain-containing protein
MQRASHKTRGFTLIELLVAMAIGLGILAAGLQLYSQCMKATFVTSERSEMQSDFRAAANLLQRDISMAGAGALGQQGIATGTIGLPAGSSTPPVYPCSTTTCNYINGAPVAYPGGTASPQLYSIIPGYDMGITVNAAEGPTDIITVAYADMNLALNCYATDIVSPTEVIFELPTAANLPATCVLPANLTSPPLLMAPGIGIQPGDVLVFGGSQGPAAGVVSSIATTSVTSSNYSNAYEVLFNSGDPGHINQPTGIATGSMAQLTTGLIVCPTLSTTITSSACVVESAVRELIVTYYLDISPVDGVTPRLMRIQNGHNPAPVAEGVSCLKFSYDIDNGGSISANQAQLGSGITPNMIMKVNILHMSIRSQLRGTPGYQSLDLQTSLSARNLTMGQEYPISGSNY